MNDTYFTVMIKENDTSNLKLLADKLNEGFHTTEQIAVGKSTVVVLRKRAERVERNVLRSSLDLYNTSLSDAVAEVASSGNY